jgi:thiol-disulfide isomerase/thioredoxin
MSERRKRETLNQNKNDSLKKAINKDRACVLFYATWCSFSRRFPPSFEEYTQSKPDECLSVIIDDNPNICDEYSIEYYPTVILFKNGQLDKRLDAKPGIGLSEKQLVEFVIEET